MVIRQPRITADEARKITLDNLKSIVIEPYVSSLSNKIENVAKEGKSSFDPWLYISSLRGMSPTTEAKEMIRQHFEQAGFKWVEHADPDPGHPGSRAYTTLSW